jgi:hypothetical protein
MNEFGEKIPEVVLFYYFNTYVSKVLFSLMDKKLINTPSFYMVSVNIKNFLKSPQN